MHCFEYRYKSSRVTAVVTFHFESTRFHAHISVETPKTDAVFTEDENSLSRSVYFTTKENEKLTGHVVLRFESPSLMSCSHSCMRNTWCSSTNFEQLIGRGDKGTCELNKHDISPVNEQTNFQDQQGCTFSLHLKVTI